MPAPYFFLDYRDELAVLAAASYLSDELVYRFPPGHRLAGARSAADMEPMRRDLFRLFVRLDYDGDAFREFLAHGVSELVLPVSSPHTKMTGGWLYSSGKLHTGVDFNDEPQPFYPYAGHTGRTNFDVHAAATGTVVGWDGLKLLTLEHVATNGRLFRTMYNMVRNVPVPPAVDGVVDVGTEVAAGQVVGQAWDPPGNVLHLHFAMAIPHQAEAALRPDLAPLFRQLAKQFDVTFTEPEKATVRALLEDSPWPPTEWFTVDPFGRYDISRTDSATYGPVGRGFYYAVPPGPATNAFAQHPIGGDPGVDPIPLFAWHDALLERVSVQPMSLGTMAAVFG